MARGVPIDEILVPALRARGIPCCKKCGKPCVMLFVGDPCDHETDHAEVDAWLASKGLPPLHGGK